MRNFILVLFLILCGTLEAKAQPVPELEIPPPSVGNIPTIDQGPDSTLRNRTLPAMRNGAIRLDSMRRITVDSAALEIERPDDFDEFIPDLRPPLLDNAELARNIHYPEEARRAGVEGEVVVRVFVNAKGQVTKTMIDQSSNALFDEAALNAVRACHFKPGLQGTRPVATWTQIHVVFSMR